MGKVFIFVLDTENCGYLLEEPLDGLKNKYAIDNHISMIRIPYTEKNNIDKILKEAIL